MRVLMEIDDKQFTANLKLPRALVLSAAVTLAGWAAEAIRCELSVRDLKAKLAECQKQPAPSPAGIGGQ